MLIIALNLSSWKSFSLPCFRCLPFERHPAIWKLNHVHLRCRICWDVELCKQYSWIFIIWRTKVSTSREDNWNLFSKAAGLHYPSVQRILDAGTKASHQFQLVWKKLWFMVVPSQVPVSPLSSSQVWPMPELPCHSKIPYSFPVDADVRRQLGTSQRIKCRECNQHAKIFFVKF